VNWQHFQAFVWLRWRLLVHQAQRGGLANAIILGLAAVAGALFAVAMFVTFFLVGLFVLPDQPPRVLLYVWTGLAAAFLFSWLMGVLVELSRAELFSLDKFLHLPVSLTGVFLLNYLSSLFSLSLLFFLPSLVALSLALVIRRGPSHLLLFPLLGAFLLLVTGVTYQFQGWLAALMANKRRRRTVVVLVTTGLVLLAQLPNLWNIVRQRGQPGPDEFLAHVQEQDDALRRAVMAREITAAEYARRQGELQQQAQAHRVEVNELAERSTENSVRLVDLVVPPGWLALGAAALAEDRVVPALLGVGGMSLLASLSLWRAYRTTLRLYTGQVGSDRKARAAVAIPAKAPRAPGRFLERQLPWLSEQASAVALAGFRGLTRAPEAKMMLLTPIILAIVFGGMFFAHSVQLPEIVRPLVAFGAMAPILLTMGQLIGNQFGFDRSGFRVFVLSAAPRREILLGKNLSFAPLALGLGGAFVILLQVLQPMRLEHFLAAVPQLISMYLLYCLLANCLSILAPMPIRSGSLRPVNPRGVPMLLHFVFSMLCPMVLAPTLLPLGIEFGLEQAGWMHGVPLVLLLAVAECAVVIVIYRALLSWQGRMLQSREQKILETVTTRAD